jgi:hypothetical protein
MRILTSFVFECMRIQSSFMCACICMCGYLRMHVGLLYVCMYTPKHIYIYVYIYIYIYVACRASSRSKEAQTLARSSARAAVLHNIRIKTPTNIYTNTQANVCTDIYMCSRHSCHTHRPQHTHISQLAYRYQTLEINIWGAYN